MPPEVEGVLALVDLRYGGRGCATANLAVVDALRRRLEAAIPAMCPKNHIALFEASWTFSCLPEFRSVIATLLENWPGGLPRVLAEAVHNWPEDKFIRLPKNVRLKCIAVF